MSAPTRGVCEAAVLIAMATLGACDRSTAPPVAHAEPAASTSPMPAPQVSSGAPFAWRLRAQSPSTAALEWFPEVAHGRVPKQVEPWACDYSLEETNVQTSADGELAEQFGVLACASRRSGMRAAALVMCMSSPDRPSECGAGNVQVMDANGDDHWFSLSCATAQSDCFTRPGVLDTTVDRMAGGSGGSSVLQRSDTSRDAPATGDLAEGEPWARWSVGMYREGFGDRRVALEDRAGELPEVADAWRCSYRVEPGATTDGTKAEIGTVGCEAQTGERVGTSIVCVESGDAEGFANAGALRLSGPETPDIALMIDCKSGPE